MRKKNGEAKASPKGDTTQKRRQSRRREKLDEIAKAAGFASWSAYETAVINGVARLTQRAADGLTRLARHRYFPQKYHLLRRLRGNPPAANANR